MKFMGIEIPKDWIISWDHVNGNIDLYEGTFQVRGLTALEVRNRLICHHKMMKESNEQHRSADQASRNSTYPQHAAGNSGGTSPNSGALQGAVPYAKQGTGALIPATPPSGRFSPLAAPPLSAQDLLAMYQAQQNALYRGMYGEICRPPTKPLQRAAPTVGELIGHRAWTVQGGNLLLSISAKSAWFPSQAMHDKIGQGQEIDDHNTAGIWAFKDPYDLANEFWSMLKNGTVFGTVWMWGTVIEHERGYRSQYAAIRSLERASPGIDIEILRAAYLNLCVNPPPT